MFYSLGFLKLILSKCVLVLDQTKGRRSLYCLHTDYMKVTFCFVTLPILKQFTGDILHV